MSYYFASVLKYYEYNGTPYDILKIKFDEKIYWKSYESLYELLRDHRSLCGNYDFTVYDNEVIRDDGEVIHKGTIVEGDDVWCELAIECIERNEHMIRIYDSSVPEDAKVLVELELLED